MISCQLCGSSVTGGAGACPVCGSPVPVRMFVLLRTTRGPARFDVAWPPFLTLGQGIQVLLGLRIGAVTLPAWVAAEVNGRPFPQSATAGDVDRALTGGQPYLLLLRESGVSDGPGPEWLCPEPPPGTRVAGGQSPVVRLASASAVPAPPSKPGGATTTDMPALTASAGSRRPLGRILLDRGSVTESELYEAVERHRPEGRRIGRMLVEMGALTEEDLAAALAEQLSLAAYDLDDEPDPDAVALLPDAVIRHRRVVPVALRGGVVVVATADPLDLDALDEVRRITGRELDVRVAPADMVEDWIDDNFGDGVDDDGEDEDDDDFHDEEADGEDADSDDGSDADEGGGADDLADRKQKRADDAEGGFGRPQPEAEESSRRRQRDDADRDEDRAGEKRKKAAPKKPVAPAEPTEDFFSSVDSRQASVRREQAEFPSAEPPSITAPAPAFDSAPDAGATPADFEAVAGAAGDGGGGAAGPVAGLIADGLFGADAAAEERESAPTGLARQRAESASFARAIPSSSEPAPEPATPPTGAPAAKSAAAAPPRPPTGGVPAGPSAPGSAPGGAAKASSIFMTGVYDATDDAVAAPVAPALARRPGIAPPAPMLAPPASAPAPQQAPASIQGPPQMPTTAAGRAGSGMLGSLGNLLSARPARSSQPAAAPPPPPAAAPAPVVAGKQAEAGLMSSTVMYKRGLVAEPAPSARPQTDTRVDLPAQQPARLKDEAKSDTAVMPARDLARQAATADTVEAPALQPKTEARPKPRSEIRSKEDLRRRASVRWYRRMNPDRMFPMTVVLAKARIREVRIEGVAQAVSAKLLHIPALSPFVRVKPVMPGCEVYPPEQTVDVTEETVTVRFQVLPKLLGEVPDARVELYWERRLLSSIPLPTEVVQQTAAKIAAFLGLAWPWLSGSVKATTGTDVSDSSVMMPAIAGVLATPWVPEAGVLGLLAAAVVFWLKNRPQEAGQDADVLGVQTMTGTELVAEGRKAAAEGRHEDAIGFFEDALNLDAGDVMALTGLARAYRVVEGDQRAADLIRDAGRRGVDDPDLHYEAASCLTVLGRKGEAMTALKKAVAGDPTLADRAKRDRALSPLGDLAEFRAIIAAAG